MKIIKLVPGNSFNTCILDPIINESIDARHMFGRLSDSEIYELANKRSTVGKGKKLQDILPLVTKDGEGFMHLTLKSFHADLRYDLFDSTKFNKKKVLNRKRVAEAIDKGLIIPFIAIDDYKVITSIPYIMRDSRPPVVYVNVSDFVTLDQFNIANIKSTRDLNNLMAILYSAYITQVSMEKMRILNANELKIVARVYGSMFAATIKTATKHLDLNMRLKMEYIGSKFFCIQLLGTDKGEDVFLRMISPQYEKILDQRSIMDIEDKIKIDDYDSLSHLVEVAIPNDKAYPSIKLNFGSFFDTWVTKFGPATAMSMDYVGYMIYIMCQYYFDGSMINRPAFTSIVSDQMMNDFFKDLVNL